VTTAVSDERELDVELTPVERAELDEAVAEADHSDSVSSDVVLAELDRIARTAEHKSASPGRGHRRSEQ
jgi:hypothetical protein